MSIGKKLLSVAALRKILTCLVVVVLFSCSKKNGSGDYCWTCRVGEGAQMRTVDTCTVDSNPRFGWEDANGNDLNHFCEKK